MVSAQDNSVSAIEWRDDALWLLDQRQLPLEEVWLEHQDVGTVVQSIRDMVRCEHTDRHCRGFASAGP